MGAYRTETAYIVVARSTQGWGDRLTFRSITRRRPHNGAPAGCIVVAVKFRIPEAAFQPISPEVIVDIPAELVQHPVEATVQDPRP